MRWEQGEEKTGTVQAQCINVGDKVIVQSLYMDGQEMSTIWPEYSDYVYWVVNLTTSILVQQITPIHLFKIL